MHKFVRNFLTNWRKLGLPFENETFVAAVSGGADSVSLMLALHDLRERKKLKNRFVIAHFNHDLRGEESAKDAEFVKTLTVKFKFEFVQKKANYTLSIANQKGNLEQNARIARYEFLRQTAENLRAFGILTAHTLNDQAETFLLNLLRGSGLSGLTGMSAKRILEAVKKEEKQKISFSPFLPFSFSPILVRPLLHWAKREDTENFCRSQNIEYRYDTMNEDLNFKRVRIRKILLPALKEFNPKIVETLANTAFLLQADFEELNKFFEGHLRNFEQEYLLLKELQNIESTTLRRGLRYWLTAQRGDLRNLETIHFEAIEKLIFSRKSGKIVELPNSQIVIKKDGKLLFQEIEVEK